MYRTLLRGLGTLALAGVLVVGPAATAVAQAPRDAATEQPMPMPMPAGSCQASAHMIQMAGQFADVLRQLRGPVFEQTFMAEMIPHHRMAIEMAQMELERGARADVKAMAQEIIASQQREVDQMTAWLKRWYGLTPEQAAERAPARARELMAMMEHHSMMMMEALEAVPAGDSFDKAFMQSMIPHHATAVIEAKTVPGRAKHAELVGLARDIISSQLREIGQMVRWLRAWYHAGPCEPARSR